MADVWDESVWGDDFEEPEVSSAPRGPLELSLCVPPTGTPDRAAGCRAAALSTPQEYEPSKERIVFLIDASPAMLEPCEVDEEGKEEEEKVGAGGVGGARGMGLCASCAAQAACA